MVAISLHQPRPGVARRDLALLFREYGPRRAGDGLAVLVTSLRPDTAAGVPHGILLADEEPVTRLLA